jgi:hypothetical protein
MLPKYQPSGAFGMLTPFAAIALIVVSVGVAWLYQFLVDLIPFIYLNGIILIGYAILLSAAGAFTFKAAKLRNKQLGALGGGLAAVFGVLASHYFAYSIMTDGSVPFGQYITDRTDAGWTIGKSGSGIPIKGIFVWVVWVIEGLILLFGGVAGGMIAAGSPFCEKCGRYADRVEGTIKVESPAPAMVEMVRKATTVREVMSAQGGGGGQHDRLEYEVRGCPTCDGLNTLSVKFLTRVITKKTEEDKSEDLHSDVLLTDAEAKALKGRLAPKA